MISINNVAKPHTLANRTANLFRKKNQTHLTIKKTSQSNQEYFKNARFQKSDLIVMMQTFESWNQLGKGTHLSDMVHEPFTELFKEGFFWSTLHGTSLKKKRMKNQSFSKKESLILQFNLKSLGGIKFQYVDVDFIVARS